MQDKEKVRIDQSSNG